MTDDHVWDHYTPESCAECARVDISSVTFEAAVETLVVEARQAWRCSRALAELEAEEDEPEDDIGGIVGPWPWSWW